MKFPYSSPIKFKGAGPVSFLVFVLLPIIAFSVGWMAAEKKSEKALHPTQFVDQNGVVQEQTDAVDISLLRDAIDIVREKYIDPDALQPDEMKYGIVRGLVWSLDDPYSEFMSPEESHEFEDELGGDVEGIGAELTTKDGMVVVISPIRGSPAENAGLLPEDVILKVDGEDTEGSDFLKVIKKIRGKKGTTVVLTIYRPALGEKLDISITRDKIRIETVTLSWNDDIALIEVSQFGTNTTAEFTKTLSDALVKNPKGIVLDLRFNSGGYLDTAVDMVSAFQKNGTVVIQKGRPPETESKITTGNVKTDLPLVILQNGGSASASEIVAGAIQDLKRGIVIGEKSFGKGTVQELVPMENGAHLRLTIAKWLTPGGRDIGEKGIEPDLVVARTIEDIKAKRDPQMDAALRFLRGESLDTLKTSFSSPEKTPPEAN